MPEPNDRAYLEDHAIVGDMQTLAVVADTGSINWFCWPRFDSPSLFGGLLDRNGGEWTIRPDDDAFVTDSAQLYLSETNVLITRFHAAHGIVEVEDLMAMHGRRRLIRRVSCVKGSVAMTMSMEVRPDYGRQEATLDRIDEQSVAVRWSDGALYLRACVPVAVGDGRISCDFVVAEAESVVFDLGPEPPGAESAEERIAEIGSAVDETVTHWQRWSAKTTYRGRWRQAVERSALVLALLIHRPTGGMIAAATTSIPERIGGDRNWDYRYVWIRDAAFTVYALLELGHLREAEAFADWLVARLEGCEDHTRPLAPLYDLDGERHVEEFVLEHWGGFADSPPVRIGNAASGQVQLDVYGELIDSLYLTDRRGDGLSLDTWDHVRSLVEHVIVHWRDVDAGIWEIRSDNERHTSSVLMCWVAIERAMRMAQRRGRPADLDRWRRARDEIHAELLDQGWNDELGSFTRTFDGDDVDASILLAPLVKFIPGDDPRWQSTLAAIDTHLAHGPLVDRYDTDVVDDGVGGAEGSFLICSFWYVEALTRAGRVDEARWLFDRLLTYASPTGLFAEEIGPDGRLVGNYPQAFSHLALISAAVHLDEALDARS